MTKSKRMRSARLALLACAAVAWLAEGSLALVHSDAGARSEASVLSRDASRVAFLAAPNRASLVRHGAATAQRTHCLVAGFATSPAARAPDTDRVQTAGWAPNTPVGPGPARRLDKCAAYTVGFWRRHGAFALRSFGMRSSILRGGSDAMPPPEQVQAAEVKASADEEEDDESNEQPPSQLVFVLVSGLLAACVTAMSMVAQRGASITTFLTLRQELMILSMSSLLAGYNICAWLALFARSRMEIAQADTTAAIFMQGVVKYGSLAVAATCLLGSLGVNINGLTAALASSGIAIGLASQRVLENLAAGIMLMVFRSFQVGDIVQVSGKMGVVCKITLIATRIDTFSNVRMSIPNKDIFGSIVENFSRNGMRRAEIEVSIAGSSDIQAVRRTLTTIVGKYKQHAERVIEAKRQRRAQALAAQRGALAIARARQLAAAQPTPPPLPENTATSAKRGAAGSTGAGRPAAPSQVTFRDFISIASPGESKEEQTRTGVQVGLPVVVLKEIKTWGYLWEVRVFLPTGQFDGLRCQLVEEIAVALRENNIKLVADIVEEKKKIVGAS